MNRLLQTAGLDDGLLRAGAVCGLIAALIYPLWSVFPLPAMFNRLLHFAFGPLLVVAFIGIDVWLQAQRPSAVARIGCVFGVIAGAAFCAMTVVQSANIGWISPKIASAGSPELQSELRRVLHGVFSVQLGLDVVWDIYITLATLLLATALPASGWVRRGWRVFGLTAAAATLFLNLMTFPVPPRDSGLIDTGPLVGAWYLGLTIMLIASIRSRERNIQGASLPRVESGTVGYQQFPASPRADR